MKTKTIQLYPPLFSNSPSVSELQIKAELPLLFNFLDARAWLAKPPLQRSLGVRVIACQQGGRLVSYNQCVQLLANLVGVAATMTV